MDNDEMERIASAHDSKAAKIRALNAAGVSTGDISRYLEIRYQHTYNVLLRAGRVGPPERDVEAASGEILAIEVQSDGTATLPHTIIDAFGLSGGGQLLCRRTADGLLLMPRDVAVEELRRHAAERMPEHTSLLTALLGSSSQPPAREYDGT